MREWHCFKHAVLACFLSCQQLWRPVTSFKTGAEKTRMSFLSVCTFLKKDLSILQHSQQKDTFRNFLKLVLMERYFKELSNDILNTCIHCSLQGESFTQSWTSKIFSLFEDGQGKFLLTAPVLFVLVPAGYVSTSSLYMSVNEGRNDFSSEGIKSGDDSTFLWLRHNLPVKAQYFMRDFGLVRAIMDGSVVLGIPYITEQYPSALSDFLRLSGWSKVASFLEGLKIISPGQVVNQPVNFERISYGDTSQNVLDIMTPVIKPSNDQPLIVFVHGGAFGSGFPAMYRLVAIPFVLNKYSVAIVGYRTYPNGLATDQMDDIRNALNILQKSFPCTNDVTLIGHSSGAYLLATSTLFGQLAEFKNISRIIALSGFYDIPRHYQFEARRGIERVSPISVACGGSYQAWKGLSPLRTLRSLGRMEDDVRTPKMFVLHGLNDTTVPHESSIQFTKAWNLAVPKGCEICLVEDSGHSDCIIDLMFGGKARETVMNWVKHEMA